MANILYISLTGMTEPLGRSQVLEYLIDLSNDNKIYLISFEREHDLKHIDEIREFIREHDIQWDHFVYSNKYGILSTIGQIVQAIYLGYKKIKKYSIDIVHARSFIPATMGLILKKLHSVKLLFDIRGFAIDEKIDRGRLKKSSLLYKILKKLDNYLYETSDHIVTLTHAAKEILHQNLEISKEKITVIPTCANKDLFKLLDEEEKIAFKKELDYEEKNKIIIHTGTVSGWYDFENEVRLVKEMMNQDENVHFLVLNKNEQTFIQQICDKFQVPMERMRISSSSFDEVHKYLNIADISLFFIKPSYSKQASAPTKFAENVACGLPSITNGNVGDMNYYLKRYDVGMIIDIETLDENIEIVAKDILVRMKNSVEKEDDYMRLFSEHFDKKMAVKHYNEIYLSLVGKR